jgi:hypothetical protein
MRIAYILKNDKNKTVSSWLQNQTVKEFNVQEEQKVLSNHLFTNKMSFIKEEFELIRNLPLESKIKFSPPASNKPIVETKNEDSISSSNTLETETDKLVNNEIGDN